MNVIDNVRLSEADSIRLREMFRKWDRVVSTKNCLHCHETGLAPSDGLTECGFCE